MRIGQGIDVHRFEHGDHIIIGGVKIPFEKGLKSHSDGDVLIHALCDALLGAAGLADIGQHFPDQDPKYAGIDSRILLREVKQMLITTKLHVTHVDLTLVAERPKFATHIIKMREILASDLNIATTAINVKATTSEGLGFCGRGEGIAAFAVVLLA